MSEELPVDLRTRRGPPSGPGPPETSLPLRKRRSVTRGAAAGGDTQGLPPRKAPRPAPPGPPVAMAFAPPPAAFFTGERPPDPKNRAPRGVWDPPPPAPKTGCRRSRCRGGCREGCWLCPPPLLLGPSESHLAAEIAAATAQDEDGDTALHIAVAQGSFVATRRLVGLFLQGGRDLDVYNRLRQTPLHLAVITAQPALVRLLVAHGASPMALDRLGRTAPHLACETPSARCLRELLRPGPRLPPDLGARNYEGLTPLHVAVNSGSRESVLVLLEHGADIDAVDIKSGRSPLLHAVESNSLEMAELLIERGASVNAQSYAGCTPLHAAAGRSLLPVLRLLLRAGANGALRNLHNETALAVATDSRAIDILRGKASSRPPPPPPPLPPQNPMVRGREGSSNGGVSRAPLIPTSSATPSPADPHAQPR
ncbi:B-cell lymphoma 3 protein [Cuculus canorus]|uniref:B-cell lymphoma 3 protein n=1 Tax=Cuculus canorus TaxID=55661 RepID=UPI0023AA4B5F|nr:B-cell lymphoma 3 protein [Cuculus canorus]